MPWVPIPTHTQPDRLSQIVRVSVHRQTEGERARLNIIVGRDLVDQLGWKVGQRLAIFKGDGVEEKGKIKLQPADNAGLKLRDSANRSRHRSVCISMAALGLEGVDSLAARKTGHGVAGNAMIVRLPECLLNGTRPKALSHG